MNISDRVLGAGSDCPDGRPVLAGRCVCRVHFTAAPAIIMRPSSLAAPAGQINLDGAGTQAILPPGPTPLVYVDKQPVVDVLPSECAAQE